MSTIDSVIKTAVDTWAEQNQPDKNHGAQSFISLNGQSGSNRWGYLHFPRPFPLGATVFEATLKVHLLELGTEWNGSHVVTVKRITERWGEYMLTWTTRPAVSDLNDVDVTVTDGSNGDLVEFDITDMLNDVSAGEEWFGVRVQVDTSSNKSLYAAEHPTQTYRAALDIEWGVRPHAPVNLTPAGNESVSITKPVLDWQFSSPDHTAIRRQTYSQVQVSTSTSFTSPSYDSGFVANTTSQWDLSQATSPTFSALSDGDVVYWRVRVKDDSGLTSEWSETARFKRTTKGTLTMSNPAVAPGNVVNDLTPRIAWGLSGRTQQAFELRLYQLDGTNPILKWRLPRTVSTTTAYNIPKGYIKSTEQYIINLRVWDTVSRAVTPGDSDVVQVTRQFTYDRAGGPDPVLNLTAVDNGPAVHLTWHRSASPAYFALVRNGKEVLDRIEPGDVLESSVVGDITFSMNYWRARPGTTGIYEVEAVEDDGSGNLVHSDGNDTDTASTDPSAIHLVDETDNTHCVIYGVDDPQFDIRISSTSYDLIGSRRPVQIVDAIGGYTGTVSGVLQSAAQRDIAQTLIGRTPTPLRLIVSDYNIQVEITEGSPAPNSIPGRDAFDVSFSFFQTDESFTVTG